MTILLKTNYNCHNLKLESSYELGFRNFTKTTYESQLEDFNTRKFKPIRGDFKWGGLDNLWL